MKDIDRQMDVSVLLLVAMTVIKLITPAFLYGT
jgi:hypothetical protein